MDREGEDTWSLRSCDCEANIQQSNYNKMKTEYDELQCPFLRDLTRRVWCAYQQVLSRSNESHDAVNCNDLFLVTSTRKFTRYFFLVPSVADRPPSPLHLEQDTIHLLRTRTRKPIPTPATITSDISQLTAPSRFSLMQVKPRHRHSHASHLHTRSNRRHSAT